MKKCPTCEKTFEDSMRFCQIDGTPLVDVAPPLDPYATIVAGPQSPAAEVVEPVDEPVEVSASEPTASAISEPEDVLQLAEEADPLKTMYVSDAEMQQVLAVDEPAAEAIPEEPPILEPAAPEPPKFIEADLSAPSFGDISPPPSPFSAAESVSEEPAFEPETPAESPFQQTTPPIPSPFDAPQPAAFDPPPFKEPEMVVAPVMSSPFEQSAAPVAWTPPPAPDASWQNQPIGQNTPFQPPPAGTGGKNQTLPIISLVLGIVSLCCYISPLTGLAALITGFLGMKNVNSDPDNFGGKGLAIAGMITGGIFLLIGVGYYVIIILMYAGIIAGSMF